MLNNLLYLIIVLATVFGGLGLYLVGFWMLTSKFTPVENTVEENEPVLAR